MNKNDSWQLDSFVEMVDLDRLPCASPGEVAAASVEETIKTIAEHGILSPILMDGQRILYGLGLLRAAKAFKMAQVPVVYIQNLPDLLHICIRRCFP